MIASVGATDMWCLMEQLQSNLRDDTLAYADTSKFRCDRRAAIINAMNASLQFIPNKNLQINEQQL